jgi:DNA modification methylase
MMYVFAKAGAFYERKDIIGDFEPYSFKATKEGQPRAGKNSRTATLNDGSRRCVLSVIQNANKTLRKSAHPTEKPSELYRFLIERYCPVGGMVLDPTMGSANSVFTAYDMNRSAIGIEKDKTFYDKAVARL